MVGFLQGGYQNDRSHEDGSSEDHGRWEEPPGTDCLSYGFPRGW
jgi:hypothetical protein